jgi:hypothetical protein
MHERLVVAKAAGRPGCPSADARPSPAAPVPATPASAVTTNVRRVVGAFRV